MPSKFRIIMKLIAVAGSYLLLYPAAALYAVLMDGEQGTNSLVYWAVFLAVGAVSYAIAYGLQRLEQKNKCSTHLKNGLYLGMILLALVLGIVFSPGSGFFRRILTGIFMEISTQCSISLLSKDYKEFANGRAVTIGAGVNVAVVLMLWMLRRTWGWEFRSDYFAYFYLAMLLCYLLLRNQANLDYMLERRRHKLEHLPQKVRWYNMFLALVLFLVVALGFCFRSQLADGIRWLGSLVLAGIRGIARFFSWLASLFPQQEQSASGMEQGEMDLSGLLSDETKQGLPTEFYLFLMLAAAVAVIVWKRREILDLLRRLAAKAAGLLQRWLNRTGVSHEQDRVNEYYSDRELELSSEEIRAMGHRRDSDSWRRWKQAYRRYCRQPAGEKKFREGYRLCLRWLKLKGEPILPSDTTLEILQKGETLTENTNCRQITQVYNQFRYREDPLGREDFQQLDQLLEHLAVRH